MSLLKKAGTRLLLILFAFTSCEKNTTPVQQEPGNELFVSATSFGVFSKTTLQRYAASAGLGNYSVLIKNDVEYFKLVYNTTYKGRQIQASGLLGIPKGIQGTASTICVQHGTIFNATEAPSNFPAAFSGFELLAAAGFVMLMPDYIGYGVSQNVPHPYYDQQTSALVVVDMLKAAKYYVSKQSVTLTNRLFLLGYSEGGYVTMAAQKEIETNAAHNLTVTAAATGAGGYDLMGMLSGIVASNTYASPSYLALLVRGYDSTYSWNRPLSDIFKQPYADKIPSLLNGSLNQAQVNAQLTTFIPGLLNPTFYANLQNPAGEIALKQQLAANSFLNWAPKSPTRLYHGTADEAVFYQTSQSTYNRFKAAGANNVEFYTIANGTHESSVQPMMANALPWIQSLDK